jgi:hypothetical protein
MFSVRLETKKESQIETNIKGAKPACLDNGKTSLHIIKSMFCTHLDDEKAIPSLGSTNNRS